MTSTTTNSLPASVPQVDLPPASPLNLQSSSDEGETVVPAEADLSTHSPNLPSDDQAGTPLDRNEKISMATTVGSAAACFTIAIYTANPSLFVFHAIAVGALGGLFHELAQSGGKIFFFRKAKDGLYLGSMTGMVLGIVAGLLVARSYTQPQSNQVEAPNQPVNAAQSESFDVGLSLEVFFAALGLKGVAEAATSAPVKEEK